MISPATSAARSASRLRASACDPAVAGDDVARGAARDQADVGGRLLVEPAQLHPRDRGRGGGDRAAAVLGPDPGVRLDPGEVGEDLLLGRRGDDHLADRAGVVEDEAALASAASRRRRPWRRAAPAPRRRSAAARSRPAAARSAWRATSSMKTATAALLSAPRIVSPRLRKTPSSSTTSIWPVVRDGVEVGAEHHPLARARPGSRASRLPAPASAGPAASSSLTSSPSARSSARDRVGDLALLAGRAADLAEPDEASRAGAGPPRREG